jgi:hypothetical protein
MANDLSPQQTGEIADALASGNKIGAIKLYRDYTGKGLKEAKDFIDLLVPQLIQKDPIKFANLAQQGKGCASVIVACLSLLSGGVILFLKYG